MASPWWSSSTISVWQRHTPTALLGDGRVHGLGAPTEVLTGDLLSEVYRCPVEVVAHPRTGAPLVLPRR